MEGRAYCCNSEAYEKAVLELGCNHGFLVSCYFSHRRLTSLKAIRYVTVGQLNLIPNVESKSISLHILVLASPTESKN